MASMLPAVDDTSAWCTDGGPDWLWTVVFMSVAAAVVGAICWFMSRAQLEARTAPRSRLQLAIATTVFVGLSAYLLVSHSFAWNVFFVVGLVVALLAQKTVERRHEAIVDGTPLPTGWQVAYRVLFWSAPKLTVTAAGVALLVLIGAVIFGPSCPAP